MLPVALTNGDVIVIIVIAAIPIGIVAFILGAGNAYEEIGKGMFALDHDAPTTGDSGATRSSHRRPENCDSARSARLKRVVARRRTCGVTRTVRSSKRRSISTMPEEWSACAASKIGRPG